MRVSRIGAITPIAAYVGNGEGFLAADPVTQHTEENPAQRPKGKSYSKHREGFQQGGAAVAVGKELQGDGGGQKAIDGKIEPLDKVADGSGDDDFLQRGGVDVFCGGGCHA